MLIFIPMADDIATCMYYTGIDPFSGQEVYIARQLKDRKLQRALMQFFKPENWFTVREALLEAGRADLIGNGSLSQHPRLPSMPPPVPHGSGAISSLVMSPSA